MEKLYEESTCMHCEIPEHCLSFPCKHLICNKCYINYYRPRIRELNKMIQANVDNFNGKCTCFGCIYRCECSLLCMDPSVLSKIFRDSNDNETADIIDGYRLFFLSIPCYFYNCEFCNIIHTDFKYIEVCPKVKERFESKYNSDVNRILSEYRISGLKFNAIKYIYNNQADLEGYSECLVFLDDKRELSVLPGKPMKIFKVYEKNIKTNNLFALVSIKAIKEDDIFVYIENPEDCRIKVVFCIDKTDNAKKLVPKEASNDSNMLTQMLKSYGVNVGFSYVKSVDRTYGVDSFVSQEGKICLLLIDDRFELYSQQFEDSLKFFKLHKNYLKSDLKFTIAKVIVMSEAEDYIVVSGYDMISYSKIYRIT